MRHLRRWGAVWLLLGLFLGSWVGQFFTQLSEFRSEQAVHGEPFVWGEFWLVFWRSTLENWQSEWLQLLFQAVLLASWLSRFVFRAENAASREDVSGLREELLGELREVRRLVGGGDGGRG